MHRITQAIKTRWPNAWVAKIAGGPYQTAGIPDLLVVVNGRLIGLEVKVQRVGESVEHARSRATTLQLSVIAALQRADATAGVVLSPEEALELIDQALAPSM